jgi:hypothetical protein
LFRLRVLCASVVRSISAHKSLGISVGCVIL